MSAADLNRSVDAVWRMESPRLIAALTRMVRDVGLAEDLAQDALVSALEQWPESGVPENPGAWLMTAAKHRAIDHFRRRTRLELKHQELGRELEAQEMAVPDLEAQLDDNVGDDLLRLMFISCHPVLSTDARVALTLEFVGHDGACPSIPYFPLPSAFGTLTLTSRKTELPAASVACSLTV